MKDREEIGKEAELRTDREREEPLGFDTPVEARVERLLAHLDPESAPPPLFCPLLEEERSVAAELLDLPIPQARRLLAEGEVSPVELARAALERIERLNPRLGAFAAVCAKSALAAARKAEREIAAGQLRSELHGIPVGVKDLIEMAGVPMEAGSAVLHGFVPSRDAPVVTRLKDAGAVIVGKTALDEFAFTTLGPATKNPLDEGRSPGGSSGGSAVAVATGMCFAAIGTDTGGSIRVPAACCGAVGLKPTYGRVSKAGVIPVAWSLDHVGPMARRVADAAALLQVIAGNEPIAHASAPAPVASYAPANDLEGVRVGAPPSWYLETVQDDIRASFDQALRTISKLGAEVLPVTLPSVDLVQDFHYIVVVAEAAAYHLRRFPGRLDDYGERARAAVSSGARIQARDYLDAQRVRGRISEEVAVAFRAADILALPTLAVDPPLVGEEEVVLAGKREDAVSAMVRFTATFDHTGHPAISIPCGTTAAGLPAGLQLVARHFDEATLLAVAGACEEAVRAKMAAQET